MPELRIIERTREHTVIETESAGQRLTVPRRLPVLAVRNVVVFPGTVAPLSLERERSKCLAEEVMNGEKLVAVVAQSNADAELPTSTDLFRVGVLCSALKLFRLPDGSRSLVVHAVGRCRIDEPSRLEPFMEAAVELLEERVQPSPGLDALSEQVREQARRAIELSPKLPDEAAEVINAITDPSALADFLAANLPSERGVQDKQLLLEELDVERRLRMVATRLASQLDILELQRKIQQQVTDNIDRTQRRLFLQEQLSAIKKELGDGEGDDSDLDSLRKRLEDVLLPPEVRRETERELKRMAAVPSISPEYSVIKGYLELVAELPWSATSLDKLDLDDAERILERDHFDLAKVKRRILEHLAVRKLRADGAGAILCFVGPPGVGKTSLGRSIAEAMGRKFVRMSLGGIRDEAEIRGHRRTYIGAMPGRIIAELRKCGTKNPVIMLDEIDKLGMDFRGDPASALLEVLDPAQNHAFTDHYLDLPFDLAKVLFIATANVLDPVAAALRDRMEVIELPGYTAADKLAIAERYLVPRQLKEHGLAALDVSFAREALELVIGDYTREAGVRALERDIAAVARSAAADVVRGRAVHVYVDRDAVARILGPPRFESELAARTSVPGVATALAYTPVGGEILFVESSRMPGKGAITLTGHIGDVMKESAMAAYSLVRSRARELGVEPRDLSEWDVHLHIPAGAVPKDGPSAGLAMFVSLASLLLDRPVRHEVAMTGEITLRGLVLPIGGLKEKSLAAVRAGIRELILPRRNRKDLPELPEQALSALVFHFIDSVDEALALALGVRAPAAAAYLQPRPS